MKNILPLIFILLFSKSFAGTIAITTAGFTFSPDSAVIYFGDTVQFTNMTGHNAVEVSAATWNANGSTPLTGGFSTVVSGNTITNIPIGLHYYVCTPHAGMGMKGRIWVLPKLGTNIDCSELFISEYIEGSGNNKAIELFNPGPSAKSLSGYTLSLFSNGALVAGSTYNLSGTINPGSTYVIANSSAAASILSVANATNNTAINFNGNDAIVLIKNSTVIDLVGEMGSNPGVYWTVGTQDSTKDEVLVRKPSYKKGNSNWLNSAANEWIGYHKDTFSYLGNHTMNVCNFPTISFVKTIDTTLESIGGYNCSLKIANFSAITASSAQVVITGGSASGADHTYSTQTVTFPANNSGNQNISIPIVNDINIENIETIQFTIRNPSSGVALGSDSVFTLNIQDNDTLRVQMMTTAFNVKENVSNLNIPVKLSHLSPNPTTINFGVKTGSYTATLNTDYSLPTNNIIIPANDTSIKNYSININNDIIIEGNETTAIEITGINNNGFIGTNSYTDITIEDEDTLKAVFINPISNIQENAGTFQIGVKLTAFSSNTTIINAGSTSGTATLNTDYTVGTSILNFAANDTATKYFTLNITDDVQFETNETILFGMSGTNGVITAGQQFNGTIIDNDNVPEISFVNISSNVSESNALHNFQLGLKRKSPNPTSATIQAFGGTANGSDYSIGTATVVFPANDSLPKNVSINLVNDILVEGNETIQFRIINLTNGAVLGIDSVHTVTINDDDTLKAMFKQSNVQINENGFKVRFGVALTAFSSNPTTLNLNSPTGTALNGIDYNQDTSSVTFGASDTSTKYFTVLITNDTLVENTESIQFTLNGTNGVVVSNQTQNISILDNDTASAFFVIKADTKSEGSGLHTFNVKLNTPTLANSSITVSIGTGGSATASDYTFSTQIINFPAGSNSNQSFSINLTDDILIEGNETIQFKLSNPTGGIKVGADSIFTLTIADNDTLSVKFDKFISSVKENVGTINVPVRLTALSPNPTNVTIGVKSGTGNTATNNTDYSIAATQISIPANDTSVKNFSINITDDILIESTETAIFEFTAINNNGVIQADSFNLNIQDNDTLRAQFIQKNKNFNEGAGSVQIGVRLTALDPNPTTVNANFSSGTAIVGTDFTITNASVNFAALDTATKYFNLQITDDLIIETSETFNANLTATNNALTTGETFTGTIIDNEIIPQLSFTTSGTSVVESAGNINIGVKIKNTNGFSTTVGLIATGGTAAGADYTIATNTVTFPANDSSNRNFILTINQDLIVEGTENIVLKLTNANNNAVIAVDSIFTLNILDDDTLKIKFSKTSESATEDKGTIKVGVSLTAFSPNPTSVVVSSINKTASGSDFNIPTTQLNWAANDTSTKFIDVTIVDDNLKESSEDFTIKLTNPTNGAIIPTDTFNVTILDNDKSSGIVDIENSLMVYPKIVFDKIYVESNNLIKTISVWSLSGVCLQQLNPMDRISVLDLIDLSNGLYIMKIATTEDNSEVKFIKK